MHHAAIPWTLLRVGVRHMLHRPWQAMLCIVGVALGVAMVVSIDLSNASARRAFTLSTDAVAGRATHQLVGGPAGIDERLYRRLRVEHGIRLSAPIVEGYVIAPDMQGITLHLLGVDPFVEQPFRSYLAAPGSQARAANKSFDLSTLLVEPNTVLIAEDMAQRYGLQPGDTFRLRIGGDMPNVRVAGILQPQDRLSRQVLETMLIADIATAQELLDSVSRLSRIDLILTEAQEEQVRTLLPPGVELTSPEARTSTLEQMIQAFELNLASLSMLALIVGMFLIYNTMTFSVVQRREKLGILRCLGVTRRQIFGLVLIEAVGMSLIGSLVGVLAGIVLGRGLVRLVTRTITDLYFVITIRNLAIDPVVLLKGFILGFLATLVAAAVPAHEATLTAPRAVLRRSSVEERIRYAVPRTTLSGLALFAIAGILLMLGNGQWLAWIAGWTGWTGWTAWTPSKVLSLYLAFAALFAILIGFSLLTPGTTVGLMTLIRPLWGRLFGLPGRMAARGVVAALSRTSVAIAALMVAVSVTIGVGIMVRSFRQTVIRWLDQSLSADIYVSPPGTMANRIDTTLDRALIDELTDTPGIAGRTLIRGVQVDVVDAGPVTLMAIERDTTRGMRALRFKRGAASPDALLAAFDAGDVFISEPLAYRTGLGAGDRLQMRTDKGVHGFTIAGVYYDYTSERGVVQLAYPFYRTYWDDPAITSCAFYVTTDVASQGEVDTVVQRLRERVGGRQELLIRSTRMLREHSMAIFDRTFAITAVLQILATIVAFIGVLSTLMALQLERTRELGMLRAVGFTPRQVWGLLLSQTGLMGLTAGILSMPVGLILALVLIYVINRRSFGWTLELVVDPWLFVQALVVAVCAALLAGIYPALRMARVSPAVALREE